MSHRVINVRKHQRRTTRGIVGVRSHKRRINLRWHRLKHRKIRKLRDEKIGHYEREAQRYSKLKESRGYSTFDQEYFSHKEQLCRRIIEDLHHGRFDEDFRRGISDERLKDKERMWNSIFWKTSAKIENQKKLNERRKKAKMSIKARQRRQRIIENLEERIRYYEDKRCHYDEIAVSESIYKRKRLLEKSKESQQQIKIYRKKIERLNLEKK